MEKRIAEVTREIEGLVARDEAARRLMAVPGIGPLAATALLAAAGNGQQFRKARDMAAWLGPVPQQYSTGGRTQMLGIAADPVGPSVHSPRRLILSPLLQVVAKLVVAQMGGDTLGLLSADYGKN